MMSRLWNTLMCKTARFLSMWAGNTLDRQKVHFRRYRRRRDGTYNGQPRECRRCRSYIRAQECQAIAQKLQTCPGKIFRDGRCMHLGLKAHSLYAVPPNCTCDRWQAAFQIYVPEERPEADQKGLILDLPDIIGVAVPALRQF